MVSIRAERYCRMMSKGGHQTLRLFSTGLGPIQTVPLSGQNVLLSPQSRLRVASLTPAPAIRGCSSGWRGGRQDCPRSCLSSSGGSRAGVRRLLSLTLMRNCGQLTQEADTQLEAAGRYSVPVAADRAVTSERSVATPTIGSTRSSPAPGTSVGERPTTNPS